MKEPGLDGRHRDQDGEIRRRNSNTKVDTLRGIYGDDFAAGRRGDATLGRILKDTGSSSLTDYLKKSK